MTVLPQLAARFELCLIAPGILSRSLSAAVAFEGGMIIGMLFGNFAAMVLGKAALGSAQVVLAVIIAAALGRTLRMGGRIVFAFDGARPGDCLDGKSAHGEYGCSSGSLILNGLHAKLR